MGEAAIRERDLIPILAFGTAPDHSGQDWYVISDWPGDPNRKVVHRTGVAFGWELDEYEVFDLAPAHTARWQALLAASDDATRCDLLRGIARRSVSVERTA